MHAFRPQRVCALSAHALFGGESRAVLCREGWWALSTPLHNRVHQGKGCVGAGRGG